MELLPLFRLIWRRRLLLGIGLVVAVALAVAIGGPPPSSSAVAWTRVALDTPTSQLVKSAPAGADTLTWRASLLVHLMKTDDVQRELARRLGVPTDQVAVVDPGLATPEIPASLPTAASDAAAMTVAPYTLTVFAPSLYLPLIAIEAAAPDHASAESLAAGAADILESQSSLSGARYESMIKTGGPPATLERFLVEQVAPIRTKPVNAPVVPIKQIGAPVFLFAIWAVGVLLLPLLLGRRRRPAFARA
jgi:hypothetical protein